MILSGSRMDRRRRPRERSNPTADSDFNFVIVCRPLTKRPYQFRVGRFVHRRIEIDDMQPLVPAEFFQQSKNVRDREFPPTAMNELDRLPALQIDAGN